MTTSKLKTIFVFALITFFSLSVYAQEVTFQITSVKGVVKVDGKKMFVGSKIKAGQTIEVEEGALVNVAHTNGKTLNISKAGTYKADDLAKGCSAPKGSLSEKYAAFVLNELTSGNAGGIGEANMKKTGSVKRGDTPVTFAFELSDKDKDKKTLVIDGLVKLKWGPKEVSTYKASDIDIKTYKFVVSDLMSNVLWEKEVTDSEITIDLNDKAFSEAMSGVLMYKVYANGDSKYGSEEHILQRVDAERTIDIKQDIASLSGDNSALNKMILAKYFEDHGLYANAMYAYEEAVKLSDNDEMYENLYQAFLDRNYLKNKTKKKATKKDTNK